MEEQQRTAAADEPAPPPPNAEQVALSLAIEKAGGPAAVARYITEHYEPITAQAVCDWKRCPPKRVLQLEAACAGVVTRHALRPDLYPPEQPRLSVAL